jgi:hypothetical protein
MKRIWSGLFAALSGAAEKIGARELMLVIGLGLVGYGLFLVFPPAAFVVPGAVLCAVAVFGVL